MLKIIRIGSFALCLAFNTSSDAAPYKGVDGQIEAYGNVMGNYYVSLAFTEICGEFPTEKVDAENTSKVYLHENFTLLNKLRNRLDEIALSNGGAKEKSRLAYEIRNTMPDLLMMATAEARKQAISPNACKNILSNLRKGVMDIRTRNGDDIEKIMGN